MMNNYFSPLATAERDADSAITKYVAVLSNRKATDKQLERAEAKRDAAIAKLNAIRTESK